MSKETQSRLTEIGKQEAYWNERLTAYQKGFGGKLGRLKAQSARAALSRLQVERLALGCTENYESALRAIADSVVDDTTNHAELSAMCIAIARAALDPHAAERSE